MGYTFEPVDRDIPTTFPDSVQVYIPQKHLARHIVEEGFEAALVKEKPDRVYRRKADGDFEAHLVALSCSEPPEDHAEWSLRLLADQVVELGYVDSVS